jgi:hypothetical protein
MVNTAVQESFDPPALQEMSALWSALVRQFGPERCRQILLRGRS